MKKRLSFMRRIKGKAGLTLVELIVSMLLVSILTVMVVGILSPAAKIFLRMQKLQYAEQILDNASAELRSMAGEATRYVKIYGDAGAIEDTGGADEGTVLEFVNPKGYVTLLSADGASEGVDLILGDTNIGHVDSLEAGRLAARYYHIADTGSSQTTYYYRKDGNTVARAAGPVFPDGYYMGNYLKITFSYPGGTANGSPVTYLEATLSLYNDADREEEHLVAKEKTALDLRYSVVRRDEQTATHDP